MILTVNGEARDLATGSTVADLVPDPCGRAVAVNDTLVPRARHGQHTLHPGDRVEIVTAVQGG